jgi:hypothetical protein
MDTVSVQLIVQERMRNASTADGLGRVLQQVGERDLWIQNNWTNTIRDPWTDEREDSKK